VSCIEASGHSVEFVAAFGHLEPDLQPTICSSYSCNIRGNTVRPVREKASTALDNPWCEEGRRPVEANT
jgi:hypothetical protein